MSEVGSSRARWLSLSRHINLLWKPAHASERTWSQLARTILLLATRLFLVSLFAICAQTSALASTAPNSCNTIAWHQRTDGLSNEYWVLAKAIHACDANLADLYPDDKDIAKRSFDANFLRILLTDKNLQDQLGSLPIKLQNAHLTGTLDLTDIASNRALSITNSSFENPPNFQRYRSKSSLILDNDSIDPTQPAPGKGLNSEEVCPIVSFDSARIGGVLSAKNLHFYCPIDMAHVRVDGPLFLDNAHCESTHRAAQDCRITISNAIITEKLSLNHAQTRGDVDLGLIQVGDELDLNALDGPGTVILDSAVVHGTVYLGQGAQVRKVNLDRAAIDGDLNISQSHIGKVSLVGARVAGAFIVSSPATQLSVNRAQVGSIRGAALENWSGDVNLAGFTYARIDGFWARTASDRRGKCPAEKPTCDGLPPLAANGTESTSQGYVEQKEIDEAKFQRWLEMQSVYSAQPYEQLARVYSKEGDLEAADNIHFLKYVREREEIAKQYNQQSLRFLFNGTWLKLTVLEYTVGYGYRKFRCIWALLLFTVLGALAIAYSSDTVSATPSQQPSANVELRKTWCRRTERGLRCLIGGLDLLIPVLELTEVKEHVRFYGWGRYYICVHKLAGAALAAILAAAFTGVIG